MTTKVYIEESGNRIVVSADASLSDFPGCTYEEGSDSTEGVATHHRNTRDNLLVTLVDPVASNQIRWGGLTDEKRSEWIAYRQALLDVPQQEAFPSLVAWPIPPA